MENYKQAIEAVKVLATNREKLDELKALIEKYEKESERK